jgi:transcriptional regulator with XRE-family HTH domain
MEKTSQNTDSSNSMPSPSSEGDQPFTSLISRESLIQRLNRGVDTRSKLVESHLDKSLAYQIRSLRGDWTQAEFAEKLGIKHANNIAARLENPRYGKHTLSTLKNIARTCDVALVVWFIPFGRFADWVTGTPYEDLGLRPSFYNVPSFAQEFALGRMPPQSARRAERGDHDSASRYAEDPSRQPQPQVV